MIWGAGILPNTVRFHRRDVIRWTGAIPRRSRRGYAPLLGKISRL